MNPNALSVACSLAAFLLAACASSQPDTTPQTAYVCNGFPTQLQVKYVGQSRATLYIADKSYPLHQTASASGVRYTNTRGTYPKNGDTVLWTKGTEAVLYRVTARDEANGAPTNTQYEKQLATCTSNPQPLPANLAVPAPASMAPEAPLPGTIPGTVPASQMRV